MFVLTLVTSHCETQRTAVVHWLTHSKFVAVVYVDVTFRALQRTATMLDLLTQQKWWPLFFVDVTFWATWRTMRMVD